MRNKLLLFAAAAALAAGCAKMKTEAEPQGFAPSPASEAPDPAAQEAAPKDPAAAEEEESEDGAGAEDSLKADSADEKELEAAPGRGSGIAATECETAECREACKSAGDLMSACVAAFGQGCFSDPKPDPSEFDCNWKVSKKESRQRKGKIGTSDSNLSSGQPATSAPLQEADKKSDSDSARTETTID